MISRHDIAKYSTHPLIRTRKGLSVLFELTNVRIIGIKTLLNQAQGTWEFVRKNKKFELSDIRINGFVLYSSTAKLDSAKLSKFLDRDIKFPQKLHFFLSESRN